METYVTAEIEVIRIDEDVITASEAANTTNVAK